MTHALFALLLLAEPEKAPLVDATTAVPNLVVDLRYATEDNFLKERMYPADARCLLLPVAAEKLKAVAAALAKKKFRLKVWDCYRPLSVQKAMWKVMPKRGWVADPNKGGSHHNRAAAVDLTLVTPAGEEVEMPTGYDSFTKAAHHWINESSPAALEHRNLLREVMEAAGFNRNPMEWWHYELPESLSFPLRDDPVK